MSLLTPTQASEIVGVPAVQLCRWAYLGQGPRNSGTKHKPMFDEDDLQAWKPKITVRGDCGVEHPSIADWQQCRICEAVLKRRLAADV